MNQPLADKFVKPLYPGGISAGIRGEIWETPSPGASDTISTVTPAELPQRREFLRALAGSVAAMGLARNAFAQTTPAATKGWRHSLGRPF